MKQVIISEVTGGIQTANNFTVKDRANFAQEYLRLAYTDGVIEQIQALVDTIDTLNKRLAHSESERFDSHLHTRRQLSSSF